VTHAHHAPDRHHPPPPVAVRIHGFHPTAIVRVGQRTAQCLRIPSGEGWRAAPGCVPAHVTFFSFESRTDCGISLHALRSRIGCPLPTPV
jgi:hypothetical protein